MANVERRRGKLEATVNPPAVGRALGNFLLDVQPQGVQLRRGRSSTTMKQEIVDEVLELAELRLLLDPMHLLGIHIRGSDPELSAGYVDARHVEPQVSPSP
jgi:hypothetical protein